MHFIFNIPVMNKNYISSILLIFAKGKQNKVKSLNTLLMYVHIKIMLQQYFHVITLYENMDVIE